MPAETRIVSEIPPPSPDMSNYWFEITDRSDLGADLKAPQTDESGNEYWSYALVKQVVPGDWVLHYHKHEHAIVGFSQAIGTAHEEPIVWAAHGTVHRSRGTPAQLRPGWKLPLTGFTRFERPVTLEHIRQAELGVERVRQELARENKKLYFPFAISRKRALRPTQGYLTRFPRELLAVLSLAVPANDDLAASDAARIPFASVGRKMFRERPPLLDPTQAVGTTYRVVSGTTSGVERDPFEVDPEVVERGLRGHAETQNRLAQFLQMVGIEPLSPRPGDPLFDVAWRYDGTLYVAEVKSITPANEERQLRLGLGQILRYRNQLAPGGPPVHGVLVPERAPSDPSWIELCDDVGVSITWPGAFQRILSR